MRVEIGPRDVADDAVFVGRRDHAHRDRTVIKREDFVARIAEILDDIQHHLFQRAKRFKEAHTRQVDDRQDFYDWFTPTDKEKPEIHGGFAMSHWCGDPTCETQIKTDLNVTIRCIPLDAEQETGACICCGKPSDQRVIFAKAY